MTKARRAAEVLGARHIKITTDGDDGPWDRGRWAEKFAELATQAQDVGARLGIEFFPWSNIKTLHDGLRLVADAGHDAGAFDLPAMITALRIAGWHGPWGVEILSDEHRSLPVADALRRAAASAGRVLNPRPVTPR